MAGVDPGVTDTLAEVLAAGNTSGANNLIIDNGQAITTNTINETTAASGVTIDSVLLKDDGVNATNLEITNLKANDGTSAGSIADSTGVVTLASSVLTTADINGGTIDGTVIGGTTAAAGSFTTGAFSGAVTANDGILIPNGEANPVNAYGATTGSSTFAIANTGGTSYFGNESSVAGTLATGTSAYGTAIGTSAARDINFFTSGATRLTIASTGAATFSGSVGVGGISPSSWSVGKVVEVETVGNALWGLGASTYITQNTYYNGGYKYANTAAASYQQQTGGSHYWNSAASGTAGAAATFTTNMVLDASGNLLVGKTTTAFGTAGIEASASNGLWSTRSGLPALALNRLSTDGSIADFYKDGTLVGSIGTQGGDLNIGTAACGIAFVDGVPAIYPWTTTGNTTSDAAIDLGDSGGRFKDLYLSGTSNVGVGRFTAQSLADSAASLVLGHEGSSKSQIRAYGINAGTIGSLEFMVSAADGTGSKSMTLDANGGIVLSTAGSYILLGGSDPAVNAYIQESSSSIILGSANTPRMTLDASGNLGLGVVPSAWGITPYKAFQIGASNGIGVIAARVDAVNEVSFGLNWYYDGGTNAEYTASGYATNYAQGSGAHRWQTAASGTAGDNITWTDAMTLDASGNLLVGTTSASFTSGGTTYTPKFATDSGSGNIAYFQTSGAGAGVVINNALGSGTRYLISFDNGSTRVGDITSNGTATTYGTSSDYRLKENIADANDAGDKIDAIKVRQYDWKVDGSHQDYGMVAQELMTVAPEAVHQPEDPEAMMGVDYSKLVPMMLKEIQSLRARVAQLEGAN
jgi:hypothetical protein